MPHTRKIECARWNDLVYVRTFKCASNFFYRNFVENAGWEPTNYKSIDWKQDHVFSFIMDPIERRHKGMAEWLNQTGTAALIKDNNFCEMIKHVPCLDIHSMSFDHLLGDHMWAIDWIPLEPLRWHDDRGIMRLQANPAANLTDRLLASKGHRRMQWIENFFHLTPPGKKTTYESIKLLWNSTSEMPWPALTYWRKDVVLYEQVIKHFKPNGATWADTTWLQSNISRSLQEDLYRWH